jgi:hypothetical protein
MHEAAGLGLNQLFADASDMQRRRLGDSSNGAPEDGQEDWNSDEDTFSDGDFEEL